MVIVGSGPAGIALAQALGERSVPVLLLESGGAAAETGTVGAAALNDGVLDRPGFGGLTEGRARGLGGTGALWHGQCMRLHDIDLRARPWLPYSGWPLRVDELSPHYRSAERWFGLTGRGYDGRRLARSAITPLPWDPALLLDDATEYTPHPHVGEHHRTFLRRSRLVTVVLHATVSRVRFKDGALAGVEVAAPDGTRTDVDARTLVLAAGAVENARLLQLSDEHGVGLGDGRHQTGRFLQTHPVIVTAEVRAQDRQVLQDRFTARYEHRRRLFPKLRLSPAAQEAHALVDACAVFVHQYDDPGGDAVRHLRSAARARQRPPATAVARDAAAAVRSAAPLVRDVARRARGLPRRAAPARVQLELWLEQAPDPLSRVVLDQRRDLLGVRQPRVEWQVNEPELRTSRMMTRWIGQELQRLGAGAADEHAHLADDEAWRFAARDGAHPSGTTRMSHAPADGVVDPQLQVHGVPGLHVVGGSVFPTAGYANPTLTIVALALRLADRLSRQP